jgi:hypothetical protein
MGKSKKNKSGAAKKSKGSGKSTVICGDPAEAEMDIYYGDWAGRDITHKNAIVVMARELRHIRQTLQNTLETSGSCPKHSNRGIADVLSDVAVAVGADYSHDVEFDEGKSLDKLSS